MAYKNYTSEFKAKVVIEVLQGEKSLSEIAAHYNLNPNMVRTWKAEFIENAEPTSPFGTKALGEPPACSGAPAIRNAILNATGVAIDHNPINPHVLYAEFSKAGLIHDDWREEEK